MLFPGDLRRLRGMRAIGFGGLFFMMPPEKDNRSRALLARPTYPSVAA
jgi:hypothetical protein